MKAAAATAKAGGKKREGRRDPALRRNRRDRLIAQGRQPWVFDKSAPARPHPRRRSRVRDQLRSRAEQRSSLQVEPNRAHQRGGPPQGRRLRSPSPVADTARCTRSASPGPHRIAKHNPPKWADNQTDRARVLDVRIHLPPAGSQQTFGSSQVDARCYRRQEIQSAPMFASQPKLAEALCGRDRDFESLPLQLRVCVTQLLP